MDAVVSIVVVHDEMADTLQRAPMSFSCYITIRLQGQLDGNMAKWPTYIGARRCLWRGLVEPANDRCVVDPRRHHIHVVLDKACLWAVSRDRPGPPGPGSAGPPDWLLARPTDFPSLGQAVEPRLVQEGILLIYGAG